MPEGKINRIANVRKDSVDIDTTYGTIHIHTGPDGIIIDVWRESYLNPVWTATLWPDCELDPEGKYEPVEEKTMTDHLEEAGDLSYIDYESAPYYVQVATAEALVAICQELKEIKEECKELRDIANYIHRLTEVVSYIHQRMV